jgi:tetratricopeptide (TPR) repeat protein
MHEVFPPGLKKLFQPVRLIARGGYGAVWQAIQRNLDRPVAVKVLHASAVPDAVQLVRFQNEARITATLSHPNIVILLDYDLAGGTPWIAYEYIAGRSLRDRLATGPVPWPAVVEIGRQVASALETAHGLGVLHRDIKPDNILESESNLYKVADFGIALWRVGDSRLTASGTILGTPEYLSPDQILDRPPGPESDVYALGATLYELLTGRPPFVAAKPTDLLTQKLTKDPPRPRLRRGHFPDQLADILLKALARDRTASFASAAEFRGALDSLPPEEHATAAIPRSPLSGGVPTVAVRAPPNTAIRPLTPRGVRRSIFRGVPVLGVLFAAVLVFAARWMQVTPPTPQPAPSRSPAPVARNTGVLTGGWQPFVALLPKLEGDSTARLSALGTLHAALLAKGTAVRPPVDFGSDPDCWSCWIKANQWLEKPQGTRPPLFRRRRPANEFEAMTDDLILKSRIAGLAPPLTPALVTSVFSLLSGEPEQGRHWFMLGRLLELDGRPEAAITAYRAAFYLQPHGPLSGDSLLLWTGLARAIGLLREQRFKDEWLEYLQPTSTRTSTELDQIWLGLVEGHSASREQCIQTLDLMRRTIELNLSSARTYLRLGKCHLQGYLDEEDAPRALATWEAGMRACPADADLQAEVILFHLQRGDIQRAQQVVTTLDPPARSLHQLALVSRPAVQDGYMLTLLRDDKADAFAPCMYVFRLMEAGRWAQAEQATLDLLNRVKDCAQVGWMARTVLAAGVNSQWCTNYWTVDLFSPGRNPISWNITAGIFTTPAGAPLMEQLLDIGRRRREPGLALAEALWLSRRRQYKESLDVVEKIASEPPVPFSLAAIAEVLTRPMWAAALGDHDAESQASRARRLAVSNPYGRYLLYLEQMKQGDFQRAAATAHQQFLGQPFCPLWQLVAIWNAARLKDSARLHSELKRARIICRANWIGIWYLKELDEFSRM